MKRWIRCLSAVLALMLLIAVPALAEMHRGMRGEDVLYLQQLLFEKGFLFEEPDGIFGDNTEQAVVDYQIYAQLPITGIVTDELMAQIENSGSGDEPPQSTTEGNYPEQCTHWEMSDGSCRIDYCSRHMELKGQADRLMATGESEGAMEACRLWKEEIVRLFDAWAAGTDEADRGPVLLHKAMMLSSMESQKQALDILYGDELAQINSYRVLEHNWREHASWLCMVLGGMGIGTQTGY